MADTRIEWAMKSWNPVKMCCTKISPGCDNCYAQRFLGRNLPALSGYPKPGEPPVLDVAELGKPSRWRKPSRIFICSMGDLFHGDVPVEMIWSVIEAAWKAKHHDFIILTKREERMADVLTRSAWWNNDTPENIWLMVTGENQDQVNKRTKVLLETPAAIHGVSVEPMLGPVDLERGGWSFLRALRPPPGNKSGWERGLDWVICGGETGPGARPMDPDCVRSLRDQCSAAGVPFFFKGWGAWRGSADFKDGKMVQGSERKGRLLDGRTWDKIPRKD